MSSEALKAESCGIISEHVSLSDRALSVRG
jgi:hypothetical protein